MREKLLGPGGLVRAVRNLLPIERRIVGQVLRDGGVTRYDKLVLHYGGDDETAWHWAEVVPTTSLERVRRSGLVFVGQSQLGRRTHRVAIVPAEIRADLTRLLESVSWQ